MVAPTRIWRSRFWAQAGRLDGGSGVDIFSAVDATNAVFVNLDTAVHTIGGLNYAAERATGSNIGTDFVTKFETVIGGADSDVLVGSAAGNRLEGRSGNDTIDGGLGNDTLFGGLGVDTLSFADATVGVSVALAATLAQNTHYGIDLISGFEDVVGSAYGDRLSGTGVANHFEGGAGNDTLRGGQGNDTLDGGADADTFAFDTALNALGNVDTITDFVVGVDTIRLENAVFTTLLTAGPLAANAFVSGANAVDRFSRILYDSGTGELFYDRDGTGAAAKIEFASLQPGLALDATAFRVI